LTTRARTVIANAALVFVDPDVPDKVLELVGSELPPASGPAERRTSRPTRPTPSTQRALPRHRPAIPCPTGWMCGPRSVIRPR